jgi:hypothetical protein
LLAVALICLADWMLSHPYRGIVHDASLYTLQAMAHVRPQTLLSDVFLRFGSQDRFTIFSPLYAGTSRLLGFEPAAAALTLISQVALVIGGFALSRAIMPRRLVPFAIAVLIAMPGDYGAGRVFSVWEPFLTPRMLAEALTLGALAAALTSRRILAATLILVATLVHPIMAAAGIVALACLLVGMPRPRWAIPLAVVGVMALGAETALPAPWGRFDPTWLTLVQTRSPYLFLNYWSLGDWTGVAVSLATLTIGATVLPRAGTRRLCVAVLATVLGGFALTLLACDLLHLVPFTQLQPWRWQWLGTALAALLLPPVLVSLWDRKLPGRTSTLLLLAAWTFGASGYAFAAALAAPAALAGLHRLKSSEARWVFWGAGAVLILALAYRLASNLEFTEAHYLDESLPLWTRRSMSFVRDGAAPLALLAAVGWLTRSSRRRPAVFLLIGVTAATCVALLPLAWAGWTRRDYPPSLIERYSALRRQIPVGSDVFWPEAPVAVWLVLDRPSYLSIVQTSGMVFSRAGALELDRRAKNLSSAIAPATFMGWSNSGSGLNLSQSQLQQACASGSFQYLVTAADLGRAPVASVPVAESTLRQMRLYHCPA